MLLAVGGKIDSARAVKRKWFRPKRSYSLDDELFEQVSCQSEALVLATYTSWHDVCCSLTQLLSLLAQYTSCLLIASGLESTVVVAVQGC